MNKNQISINPVKIILALCILALFLILASICGQLMIYVFTQNTVNSLLLRFIRLFQLNQENNIPTLFTVLLMIFISLLLWVIIALSRKQKTPYVSNWVILALGFMFMAFDEAFQVHERFVDLGRTILCNNNLGIFYNSWIIFYIPLVLLLLLFFLRFLFNLPLRTRLTFLIAASIYLGGCIGMEMIDGSYAESHGTKNLVYNMMANIEDSLEIIGLLVFSWALLSYIADNYKEVLFKFDGFSKQS